MSCRLRRCAEHFRDWLISWEIYSRRVTRSSRPKWLKNAMAAALLQFLHGRWLSSPPWSLLSHGWAESAKALIFQRQQANRRTAESDSPGQHNCSQINCCRDFGVLTIRERMKHSAAKAMQDPPKLWHFSGSLPPRLDLSLPVL